MPRGVRKKRQYNRRTKVATKVAEDVASTSTSSEDSTSSRSVKSEPVALLDRGVKRPRPRCEGCDLAAAGEACIRTRCLSCCKAYQGSKKSKKHTTTCKFHDKVDALLLSWVEGYQERVALRNDPTHLTRTQHVERLFEHEGDTACLFSLEDLLSTTAYKKWKPATISQSRMSKWHIETQFRLKDTETRKSRFKKIIRNLRAKHGIDERSTEIDTNPSPNEESNSPASPE